MPQEYQRIYDSGGGSRDIPVSGGVSVPQLLKFPGLVPSLIATLVAGSTAVRTSGVVTVTATAHAILTGPSYVGYRFFYPGSPNLVAGWYNSITSVTTNTIVFTAPGADFTSESVNAGAIYTTTTTVAAMDIKPGDLKVGSFVTVQILRGGGFDAYGKAINLVLGSTTVSQDSVTSSPARSSQLSFFVTAINKQNAVNQVDGVVGTSLNVASNDLTVATNLSLTMGLSNSPSHSSLIGATVEIRNP
jgi:hypothetical protein